MIFLLPSSILSYKTKKSSICTTRPGIGRKSSTSEVKGNQDVVGCQGTRVLFLFLVDSYGHQLQEPIGAYVYI